jgi:hypothetical protein
MNEKKDGDNPSILILIPFIYRYLSIIYREGLAINHPWTQ